MMKTVNVRGNKLITASIVYIFLPIVIWIFTWCRFLFSIPAIFLILLSVVISLKKTKSDYSITITYFQLVGMVLISVGVGVVAGWGGLTPQAYDWHKHNALLRDLINNHWPVYYSNHGFSSFLTYYLGQYIFPASISKCVGMVVPLSEEGAFIFGEMLMLSWNCIGLLLVFFHVIHLCHITNRCLLLCVGFLAFGSLLPVGKCILSLFYNHKLPTLYELINQDVFGYHNLDLKLIEAQYTTNFVQLRWVFQQSIVCWLVMSIFLEDVFSYDSYIVLGLPLVCFAAFPFVGTLPFFLVDALRDLFRIKDFKGWFIKCISIQNLLILCSLGSFLFLYLCGQFFGGDKPNFLKFQPNYYTVLGLLVFWFSSFGFYAILLIPALRNYSIINKEYFTISIIILLLLPLYRIGWSNDFAMRVSMPALFVLCIAFLRTVSNSVIRRKKIYWLILLIAFIIGAFFPAVEFESILIENDIHNHQELADDYKSLEYYANPNLKTVDPLRYYLNNERDDISYNYFTYNEDMRVFVNTISKPGFDGKTTR